MIRLAYMNDTIIKYLSETEQTILRFFLNADQLQSSDISKLLSEQDKDISIVSVKRSLSNMLKLGVISVYGAGRSTAYSITTLGRIICDIDPEKYVQTEPDKRAGLSSYNFDLFKDFPSSIFNTSEVNKLDSATGEYRKRLENTSSVIREKELQRLVIELSWKSSKIEGNTYTLLDTEKLILDAKEASGHDKNEAKMILNHKDAFNFIRDNSAEYKNLTLSNLESLHSILVKGLGISTKLRHSLVGITGSKYKPLDNVYQIKEAIESLSLAIHRSSDPYAKALLALLGISYIQPFEDGNKRTSRLMADAILMAHQYAPLSYRSIDETDYRNAVLVFYEINSIIPSKKLFIEQYIFAADNYSA